MPHRVRRRIGVSTLIGLAITAANSAIAAETAPPEIVITAAPIPGGGVARDKIAANPRVIDSTDIRGEGNASILKALESGLAGVSLDQAQNNPFQPNMVYRGFEASPLAGDAQGLAVYVNGVRFNQSFGDTVNWDLIPDSAVERMTLEGSNAVFGLNALGGSLAVQMKNGFTHHGASAEVSGGSFGRIEGGAELSVGGEFDLALSRRPPGERKRLAASFTLGSAPDIRRPGLAQSGCRTAPQYHRRRQRPHRQRHLAGRASGRRSPRDLHLSRLDP